MPGLGHDVGHNVGQGRWVVVGEDLGHGCCPRGVSGLGWSLGFLEWGPSLLLQPPDGEVDLGKRYLELSYKTGMYFLTNRLRRLSNRFSDVRYLLLH